MNSLFLKVKKSAFADRQQDRLKLREVLNRSQRPALLSLYRVYTMTPTNALYVPTRFMPLHNTVMQRVVLYCLRRSRSAKWGNVEIKPITGAAASKQALESAVWVLNMEWKTARTGRLMWKFGCRLMMSYFRPSQLRTTVACECSERGVDPVHLFRVCPENAGTKLRFISDLVNW